MMKTDCDACGWKNPYDFDMSDHKKWCPNTIRPYKENTVEKYDVSRLRPYTLEAFQDNLPAALYDGTPVEVIRRLKTDSFCEQYVVIRRWAAQYESGEQYSELDLRAVQPQTEWEEGYAYFASTANVPVERSLITGIVRVKRK